MSTANPNNRASLLAGLRTGGVRSSSLNVPHTAAPSGQFNVPRIVSYNNPNVYYEEEEDQFNDIPQQGHPHIMNPNSLPFSPGFAPNMMQQQQQFTPQNAMQMQMLQIEMFKIQQVQQAQQLQAEMLAQAQAQRQQQMQAQAQARERRTSAGYNPPATAGPMNNSFDLRSTTVNAQMRRANQADQLRAQLGLGVQPDDQVPMTAALGGRFGSRSVSLSAPADDSAPPPTPNATTVISGGTSLGAAAQSKSDAASSWRRGGNNNSVLSGNRAVSSPSVKITPPPIETKRVSPPPGLPASAGANGPKFRPQPLRFSSALSQSIPADTHSSDSSVKSSSPTTPRSSSSNEMPLSPREEASKKLYEGLGIGRPVSATPSDPHAQQYQTASAANHRMVSQPTRQPRGPPSGTEELGPKNFASRIRRKAIGGLGALMDARERREFVEAY
ncbi:hypothetical protein DFP72DRAFT_987219 [Ephemerocybe angulata]|uniref:Uncharacterized protein n=1 Tax=Ephemerocybe angulata TaxID=980116 RepID=A0A8H6IE24_9AGAR|nr:hypothetical protein DFP72DRAFT_987219 [Tulosesus angulatus]